WLADHFPFIHWKNIVFCGDKSIIKADYMIDDHVKNLLNFDGKGLLFTASHNAEETRFTRVNNWREVEGFFYERMRG
ncbi:MAG TPA: 5'(3')-deoxyribonucleotidase, partial [Flavilitoribacter sp.]|nr:5'(3')-deoxyribonucleotidase [Flavilitoribacter sp.]